ncbi:hypothetical protein [Streptomyces sp. NPDC048442]|uniref:hypothetical protein n=1 Tax=Streptomyces sp. NPDC048442 TaxID=3154823 RepID=UPI00341FB368
MSRVCRSAGLLVLVGVMSGCGAVEERRDAAHAAVARFERAVRAGDAAAMCGALAPGTREELEHEARSACAASVLDEDLPYGGADRHVDIHGRQARAVLEKDTVFLSQFPEGWKVVAAGCRPQGDQPYRCTVKGS